MRPDPEQVLGAEDQVLQRLARVLRRVLGELVRAESVEKLAEVLIAVGGIGAGGAPEDVDQPRRQGVGLDQNGQTGPVSN